MIVKCKALTITPFLGTSSRRRDGKAALRRTRKPSLLTARAVDFRTTALRIVATSNRIRPLYFMHFLKEDNSLMFTKPCFPDRTCCKRYPSFSNCSSDSNHSRFVAIFRHSESLGIQQRRACQYLISSSMFHSKICGRNRNDMRLFIHCVGYR